MAHKTYFAVPNFDYPPYADIELGQIITSPGEPWRRLSAPLDIPEKALRRMRKFDWGTEMSREREQRVGIWAQFAAMIVGVGADAVFAWTQKNAEVLQCDELETTFFDPDAEYVTASIMGEERAEVAQWLRANGGKSVYMITGLKIARGAQHLRERRRGIDFDLRPGVDATPFSGVPVSGGPMVGGGREKGEMTWFSGSSDFVFAYRLRRIIVKKQVVSKSQDFVRGATVLHDNDESEDAGLERLQSLMEREPAEEVEIQSVGQSRNDYGAGSFHLDGFSATEATDEEDGEACLLQLPEDVKKDAQRDAQKDVPSLA